jgi:hypothetical protein
LGSHIDSLNLHGQRRPGAQSTKRR